ncbi:Peptidase S41 family protein [Penicillium digitatum]|uniref:Peptidase S41 family protein n=3 Tax=Penicillium digitatum TaxID=36651 RepID=K9G053_PEND2|nr:Peptidase S41 family protein [Penicillium digitatum Pd1]EKV10044.1 Peptidase S41 family protein [Penicillium digitatum Pd1]EKV15300.1 Peptidase S41 family protein [Penicillium digitatum PHI26]QQK44366.1 Peptidase S41 family protein [Penicillium digitatum]
MHLKTVLTPVALAAAVRADRSTRDVEPCAQISNLVEEANNNQTNAIVPHDLAHQCLLSMPFDSDRAVDFLIQVRKILEFQSTIDILKDPPLGYAMPSTDIMGEIDIIMGKAKSKSYASQFEMDLEINHLITTAHDGHLVFQLCSQSIFTYQIDMPLVSISTDALALPQVYTLDDAKLQKIDPDAVSPLVSINGTDVATFLESYAKDQNLQDRDAQYNRVFPAPARSVTNTPTSVNGIWASIGDWTDGAQLSLKFGNGTEKTIQKTATPSEKFFSYKDGTSLYEIECLSRDLSSASSSPSSAEKDSSEIAGFPSTTWRNSANSVAGYYSKLSGLEDTAIIFLPTFSSSASEVAKIAVNFLQNSTESGKKNVLIDLSSNPGGYMSIGIDLSRIFFPNATPYTATRFRAHDAAKYLTKAYSRDNGTDTSNVFAHGQMVRPDQRTDFGSWEDLYGPHEILGSSTSSLLANFNYTSTSSKNFPINGYGPVPLNPSKPPFSADNIALITDGDCVSTCAFFVKLMKRQGVRTIAFGGRPQKAPMQGVGGVKGGQSLGINYINGYIEQANGLIRESVNSGSPILTSAEWKAFNESSPSTTASLQWSGNLNLRNEYDPEDGQTPLQFVYEAAECRLFYTLENYLERETVWQAAAKAMFGSGQCVEGSTKGKGSLDS